MNRLDQFHSDYLALLTPETLDGPKFEELYKPAPTKLAYCFTINNPEEKHIEALKKYEDKYNESTKEGTVLIWELEVGWGRKEHTNKDGTKHSGKNTLHIQGYMQLTSKQSPAYIKTILGCPTAHITIPRGSWQANDHYCSKDRVHETFAHLYTDPNTWGRVVKTPHPESKGQGARGDVELLKADILSGMSLEEIKHNHFGLCLKYNVEKMMSLAPKKVKPTLYVEWHWGVSGSGKTYDAKMTLGVDNTYIKTLKTGFWWDGYDPDIHQAVIIDEADKNDKCWCLSNMLPLMDENNLIVQVKGGSRVFRPTHLFITSTKSPQEIYTNQQDYDQIIRRCDKVVHYKNKKVLECKKTVFGEA